MGAWGVLNIAAALQAAAPVTVLELPSHLNAQFAVAVADLEFAGGCIEAHPNRRLDAEYQIISNRHEFDRMWAEKVWGTIEIGMGAEDYPDPPAACTQAKVKAALQRAVTASDRARRSVEQATEPLKQGAWIGALRLCRDTVSRTEIGQEILSAEPAVTLTLTATGRAAFADLTRRSVGTRLAIRVDGKIVSEPMVNEPIESGVLQLPARNAATLDRARMLSALQC